MKPPAPSSTRPRPTTRPLSARPSPTWAWRRWLVRNAEIELGYCRMTAPIDGRISRLNYHVGNLVGDGQSIAPGDDRQDRPDLRVYQRQRVATCCATGPLGEDRPRGGERERDADGAGPRRRTGLPAPRARRLPGPGRRPGNRHHTDARDLPQPRRRDPAGVLRPGSHPSRSNAKMPCLCPSGRSAPTSRADSCWSWARTTSSSTARSRSGVEGRRTAGCRGQDRPGRPRRRRWSSRRPVLSLKVIPDRRGGRAVSLSPPPSRSRPPITSFTGHRMLSRFFIERPIFANVIAIMTMLVGAVTLFGLAGRAVSRASRRRRSWSRPPIPAPSAEVLSDTVASLDRAGGQRRRGHALHVLDLLQRRLVPADRHVRRRHRPGQGPGAGAKPPGDRPAPAAAGGPAAGSDRQEAIDQHHHGRRR